MSIQLEASRALIWRAAASAGDGFPDALQAAQAKVMAADMAIKVTNDALQLFGAAGYSQSRPLERMVRDARMFTIAGGTAQILRTVVASRLLGERLPQTRDGYLDRINSDKATER
jgi:alkylation response protein AidB-like acyl-CoA dehydrogenase